MVLCNKKKEDEEKNIKMNKKKLVLLIILLIILTSIVTLVVYFNIKIYQIRELPMMVEVKNKLALGIYKGEQLNFGIVGQGGAVSMSFNITSNKDADVIIIKKGNISDFVTLSENDFYIQRNELKKIGANLRIPSNTEFGNYSGKLIIILRNI